MIMFSTFFSPLNFLMLMFVHTVASVMGIPCPWDHLCKYYFKNSKVSKMKHQ